MDDSSLVQVVHRTQHVSHQFRSPFLPEDESLVLPAVQEFEQLSSSAEIGDDIDGPLAEEYILDLDDVGVVKGLQDRNLGV